MFSFLNTCPFCTQNCTILLFSVLYFLYLNFLHNPVESLIAKTSNQIIMNRSLSLLVPISHYVNWEYNSYLSHWRNCTYLFISTKVISINQCFCIYVKIMINHLFFIHIHIRYYNLSYHPFEFMSILTLFHIDHILPSMKMFLLLDKFSLILIELFVFD